MYQVRHQADASKPESRGYLVAQYLTYEEAAAHCQELHEAGDKTAFVSVAR